VVNVALSDQSAWKPRPALVVSTQAFHRSLPDVIVCPISSQPRYHRKPGPGDHPLRRWRALGLRHPSTARVSKLLSVDKKIIKRVIGVMEDDDLEHVERELRGALGL